MSIHETPTNELNDTDPSAVYYPVSEQKMVRGEGVYLFDDEGRSYLDCASATFNLSLGYSHPAVVTAIKDQAGQLHARLDYGSDDVTLAQLAERVNYLRTTMIPWISESLEELAPASTVGSHPALLTALENQDSAMSLSRLDVARAVDILIERIELRQALRPEEWLMGVALLLVASSSGIGYGSLEGAGIERAAVDELPLGVARTQVGFAGGI